jgi:hypothetical protein
VWVGALLLELELLETDSIKDKRRVVRSIKDRLSRGWNVSIAEVDEQGDRHRIVMGIARVGIDPRHLRRKLEQLVEYVDGLALAPVVSEELVIARLDELEDEAEDEAEPHEGVPREWHEADAEEADGARDPSREEEP